MRVTWPGRQGGITLIEMMVAIVVGLILLAGIIQLFVSNKQAYRIQESFNVLNENARYALNQLEHNLRMAGHWGGAPPDKVTVVATAPTNDCTQSPALTRVGSTAGGFGVEGFDGAAGSPLDCIPNGDYEPFTDILIVRYGGPDRIADDFDFASVGDSQFVRVFSGRAAEIFDGRDFNALYAKDSGTSKGLTATASDSRFKDLLTTYTDNVVVYFIRRCASQERGTPGQCDAADDSTPTLARLVLRNGQLVQEDVIAGVEQLQVVYGVDATTGDDDIAPNAYYDATTVTANNDWPKVSEVRLSMILRAEERDVTFSDDRTYRLYGGAGGQGVAYQVPADAKQFRRKVFNTSVQVRNLTRSRR